MHIKIMKMAATIAVAIGLAGPIAFTTYSPAFAGQSKGGGPRQQPPQAARQNPMAPDGPIMNPNWPYNSPMCDQSGPLDCYTPSRDRSLEWIPPGGGPPGDVKKGSPVECLQAGVSADCFLH